jgi:cysteinyl-tRNA synthetase
MNLNFYDILQRKTVSFTSLEPDHAGLYSCGPTVYDYAHIGNFRTYLFVDLLKRTLMINGYTVKHVMNINDVGRLTSDADTGEDKMEKGSRQKIGLLGT